MSIREFDNEFEFIFMQMKGAGLSMNVAGSICSKCVEGREISRIFMEVQFFSGIPIVGVGKWMEFLVLCPVTLG